MTTYLTIPSRSGGATPRRVDLGDIARLFSEGLDEMSSPAPRPSSFARLAATLGRVTAPLRETMRLLREEALARRRDDRARATFSADPYF